MRAAVVSRYCGPEGVRVVDVPVPSPKAGEVLVRVEAVGVTSGDARMRSGRFPPGFGPLARMAVGIRGPRARVLGNSLSGTVVAVGPGVTAFGPGDEVAGMTGARMRAHAEFAVAPGRSLAHKPASVTYADAAGVLFGGTTALHFLRDRARVASGETVLINGASGAVGSAAVQIASHLGADVVAVAGAANHEFVRRLGATRAIDYAQTPIDALDERFDVVVDAVGNLTRAHGLHLLADRGRLVLVVASLLDTLRARGRVIAGPAPERSDDIATLLELVASGSLDPVTQVIGDLDALPEAYRIIDSRRKVGSLVVAPNAAA